MTTRTRPLSALNAVRSTAASGPSTMCWAVGPSGTHPAAATQAAPTTSLRNGIRPRALWMRMHSGDNVQ